MKKTMKASTKKLLSMLPRTFIWRIDVVDGVVVGADVLNGQGQPTNLRTDYPGFATNLDLLLALGRVVHIGDTPKGSQVKGQVERLFLTVRPDPA